MKISVNCLLPLTILLFASKDLPKFPLVCEQGKTPEACLNQKVELEVLMTGYGEKPDEILQHPNMLPPMGKWYQYQTRFSSNLGQLNLISPKEIACPKLKIEGILSKYELGCKAHEKGKCEYSNYVVNVKNFQCLK
ncbi:hypothetical protein COW36_22540 [bacterium (Candidatus Blackallbacteria) CG17_big_fil_post_rev_8_21_14_2_50_48_46]|uniref:Uncharacterized protein n=1 Tax=bacterium (Candidatus Blackallbacteria) CG17_big_fil_post_rev_8_21_14_2_50_48_46 TaxID=2014261 RepID=A0A2M7FY01_9BACT|nr:MAG: hypothetical protein COW64_07310 [bacterium (Candidatus Blackallbacteria) CG18_big_fil_WC_8_21_14_2_50_49_26]PIW14158.1 MAG: hypothetical protein COW36_22540 [bacterium (Candidatus Blackallbacteria) CG17_big_fil_post_rev_8_21_14_2_50_48_46]PIW46699.1 MAG: hypothetical protein COW20_14815 [bacterium (Candidatus Blackallbacteria) CG13_big_fil_rev_8_21_14_2_50_49_14]